MTQYYVLNSVLTIPEITKACKNASSFKSGEIRIKCSGILCFSQKKHSIAPVTVTGQSFHP